MAGARIKQSKPMVHRNGSFRDYAKGLAITVACFVILDALLRVIYLARNSFVDYVPLPYVVGDEYGPTPPWLDRLRMLERDKILIWRNRPNFHQRYIDIFAPTRTEQDRVSLLRRFIPRIPQSLKDNPVWQVSTNSQGFRDIEFPPVQSSRAFRIVCLGDSWTFGWNVGQEFTYPAQLKNLLKQTFPDTSFEVFNLGVGGYSSYQGLQLLKRKALALQPDLVVIGFAMNDSSALGYNDKDLASQSPGWGDRISGSLSGFELYKLMRYLALRLRENPRSLGQYLQEEALSAQKGEDSLAKQKFGQQDYEKLQSWTRVPLSDFENNIVEMLELTRNVGAEAILLYNAFWRESPYKEMVLEKISKAGGVPLVDSSVLLGEARKKMEDQLEKQLNLLPPAASQPGPDGEIDVVFRVYANHQPVSRPISIVGTHPKLGNLTPNRVAMRDDGTHGDQRAKDNVWSYSATFPRKTKLFYVYLNGGEEGKWEGLDVPSIRAVEVEDESNKGKIYRPIESFGKLYMQSDNWHTNAVGYELIAKALVEVLKNNQKVNSYLRRQIPSRTESFR
jgi:lysophospholipase L1-like esterase